uniref:Leucine-rich repeat protein n=1 Tax=Paramoeba aestuarina TaxID=180227 RepID=A0A7S4NWK7_9EUKA|mmetsp:Transcript_29674/g.45850  ORF Transcript_29674/g.45850 Transcript_29674/m.45850 type:complete len:275 (+) Transcript_29674:40-864(+)
MSLCSIFMGLDPTVLSRPDKNAMPQQTLLELLVANFDDKNAFRDADGYFDDIKNWRGVSLNDAGDVTAIDWEEEDAGYVYPKPGGSIDLSWIPSTVRDFDIPQLTLQGTIDTFELPRKLRDIDVSRNLFTGTLETGGLPRDLRSIYVGHNQLTGTLDIQGLPRGLKTLSASKNSFSGPIVFSDLPETLHYCMLSNNSFSGFLDMSVLPENIKTFIIDANAFETPNVLIVPVKSMMMCQLDKGTIEEVRTTEGEKLDFRYFHKDIAIRVVWQDTV